MRKITLALFLGCTFLAAANFKNATGINPVHPKKASAAPFAAVNDNCATAIAITSLPYSNTQTDGADAENDGFITVCTGEEMNDGLWYTVEGTGSGIIITVTPDDEEYDFELGVFSGSCDALECVGTTDNGYGGELETYSFQSEIGVTYYINIGHYSPSTDNPEANFTIEVDSFEVPVNDNCAGAIEITSFPYSNEQTDGIGATLDGLVEACADYEMNDGMWYKVVGNGNNLEITVTTGVGYDAAIGVFTGSCDAFSCVETVDAVSSGEEFLVIPSSEVGTVYYINVGNYEGFDDEPEGNFSIEVNSVVPPDPADCAPAAIFPLNNATDVAVGTMEFSWEAPTTGGPIDSYDLYGGTTTPLTEEDFIDNYDENSATITITGFSTVFYWKAVPRNSGGQAADCIEWTFTTVEAPPVPENDACDTATVITAFPFNETIDATSATNNEGNIVVTDCGSGMNDGIWYTVEGNGSDIVITATSLDWDGELAIYTGSCGTFTCYDSIDDGLSDVPETLTITASEIGTLYYINFGHYDGFEDDAEGQAIIEVTSDDLGTGSNQFKNFTAYPNPVKDVLNLSHTENISNVEVFNLLGQKMLSKVVDATQSQLDLSRLSSGSYLVKVTSGNETKTIKVLKQ